MHVYVCVSGLLLHRRSRNTRLFIRYTYTGCIPAGTDQYSSTMCELCELCAFGAWRWRCFKTCATCGAGSPLIRSVINDINHCAYIHLCNMHRRCKGYKCSCCFGNNRPQTRKNTHALCAPPPECMTHNKALG